MTIEFPLSPRIRKSPYFEATLRWGAKGFLVYNKTYLPMGYRSLEEEFWQTVNAVTLWDVAVQRIVEIRGPDALRFADSLTPRDLSKTPVGSGRYVVITGRPTAASSTIRCCCAWPRIASGCRGPTATSCSGPRGWPSIRGSRFRSASPTWRPCRSRDPTRSMSWWRCSARRCASFPIMACWRANSRAWPPSSRAAAGAASWATRSIPPAARDGASQADLGQQIERGSVDAPHVSFVQGLVPAPFLARPHGCHGGGSAALGLPGRPAAAAPALGLEDVHDPPPGWGRRRFRV